MIAVYSLRNSILPSLVMTFSYSLTYKVNAIKMIWNQRVVNFIYINGSQDRVRVGFLGIRENKISNDGIEKKNSQKSHKRIRNINLISIYLLYICDKISNEKKACFC